MSELDTPRHLLLIEWVDSCSLHGGTTWKRVDDLDATPNRCRSIGWLILETKDAVTIASSVTESQVSGDITIPTACITSRRRIPVRSYSLRQGRRPVPITAMSRTKAAKNAAPTPVRARATPTATATAQTAPRTRTRATQAPTRAPTPRAPTPPANTARTTSPAAPQRASHHPSATPPSAHIARARGEQGPVGQAGEDHDAQAGATAVSREPKKNGRPRFEPTPEMRKRVETLAGYGIPQTGIASMIVNPHTGKGIDEETLRQCFAYELDQGVHRANSLVGQSLFQKATGNGHQSVAAAIFWLKCRAGWRERVDIAVDIKGGVLVPPATLTPEQWIAAQAAMNAARAEPGKNE